MNEEIVKYKVKKCLQCGAETNLNDNEELFCSKCGAPLVNRCSNYSCKKFLKENDKYCKHCGSASTFNNYGILDFPPFPLNIDNIPF